ncbi:MAG: stage V sporulation protein AD [Clostridia bacterium]|nr:stage V sporulation protein AD [Clostridia bacterium]
MQKEQTFILKKQPRIIGSYTIVGPKEGNGNFGEYFDYVMKNDCFGEKTFERAERKMLETAITGVIQKANLQQKDIDLMIAGDLLNQIVSSSYAARMFQFPFLGVYGACSTMAETIALGSILVDSGYCKNVVCCTGSHFSTAERQYRFPLELGNQRPPTAQWTVTGAGASVLSLDGRGPKISMVTLGRVVDWGVNDVNNMGAAMAPAARDTLLNHLANTKTTPDDYDLILTGDLGKLGSEILIDLMEDEGVNLGVNYGDCGQMYFKSEQETLCGGSGSGCCATVFNSYIIQKLKEGQYRKILFLPTGALLSPTSTQQGDTIPCVCHAVVIENDVDMKAEKQQKKQTEKQKEDYVNKQNEKKIANMRGMKNKSIKSTKKGENSSQGV